MSSFIKTIKQARQNSKNKYESFYKKNASGDYIINVKTNTIDDLAGKYSIGGYQTIDSEFFESLDDITDNLSPNSTYEIVLDLSSDKKDDDKKNKFIQSFKNHYVLESLSVEKQKKTNIFISIISLITGLIFFGVIALFEFIPVLMNIPDVVWELLVVVEWVFIWDALGRLCFNQPALNTKQVRNYHLYNAKIKFTVNTTEDINAEAMNIIDVIPSLRKVEAEVTKSIQKLENLQNKNITNKNSNPQNNT